MVASYHQWTSGLEVQATDCQARGWFNSRRSHFGCHKAFIINYIILGKDYSGYVVASYHQWASSLVVQATDCEARGWFNSRRSLFGCHKAFIINYIILGKDYSG